MIKARSSHWKTILPATLLGLIITLVMMFGTTMIGISVSPTPVLAGLFIATGVAAWRFPQQRTRLLSMIAGGTIGLVVFVVVVVFALSDGLFSTSTHDDLKPAELEQWIGLDLPSSAINMRSHAEGFQDWQVFVRFEMPEGDVKEFLRINKLEPQSDPKTQLSNTDLERDWWTPDGSTKPRLFVPKLMLEGTPQPSTKTGFYPTIQISELDSGQVLIFVNAFNT